VDVQVLIVLAGIVLKEASDGLVMGMGAHRVGAPVVVPDPGEPGTGGQVVHRCPVSGPDRILHRLAMSPAAAASASPAAWPNSTCPTHPIVELSLAQPSTSTNSRA